MACFSQYNGNQALPIEAPVGWSEAAVSYTGLKPDQAMTFNGSAYICDMDNFTPFGRRYVVTNSIDAGDGIYWLDILVIYGPDDFDVSGYKVDLVKNESPDIFGFQWRIHRIVRML